MWCMMKEMWMYFTIPIVFGFTLWYTIMQFLRQKKVDLKDKVVLITGASSGVGKACARLFYHQGCRLILAGRDADKLQLVTQSLLCTKGVDNCKCHVPITSVFDLEDVHSVCREVTHCWNVCQCIDIVICNAGMSFRGCIQETCLDVDRQLMAVNYFGHVALVKDSRAAHPAHGAVHCRDVHYDDIALSTHCLASHSVTAPTMLLVVASRLYGGDKGNLVGDLLALLPLMVENNSGCIVGISSLQGKFSLPYRSAYSASKHAFQAFFDCLRAELADTDIDVCLVSPSYIRTNLSMNAVHGDGTRHGVLDDATASGMSPDAAAGAILRMVISRDPELVLAPFFHRIIAVIRVLFPSLFFWIMKRRATLCKC